MKKAYVFLLFLSTSYLNLSAQSDCSGAYSNIVYALSHTESALDANNVTHAKHFSERAREAFERVQDALKKCDCDEVDDLVYDAINYLAKSKTAEKLDDAYYYANKGKKLAEATIEKLDICTSDSIDTVVNNENTVNTETTAIDETGELSSIEDEKNQLEQQQLELERRQVELKQRIAQKKKEELDLKKEELILKMELTVANNVNTFNAALKACECDEETLKVSLEKGKLKSKSLNDIKASVVDVIKELTSNYIKQLVDCDNDDDDN
ncbi:hypothetical protein FBALC1_07288 [Flavobacteriales bacterium ALC-1]|nr:hypothetical protein FBALC1_07288 [Flavobacteriales bacterium ALC-1]